MKPKDIERRKAAVRTLLRELRRRQCDNFVVIRANTKILRVPNAHK